jgi:hypothetical protein
VIVVKVEMWPHGDEKRAEYPALVEQCAAGEE